LARLKRETDDLDLEALGEAYVMSWRNQLYLAAVLAIIAAIVGGSIYLPRRAKEIKSRDDCAGRLQSLGYALYGYRYTHENLFPPGSVPAEGVPPEKRLSWVTLIYQFFDESQNVDFLFDNAAPWDSDTNRIPRIRTGGFGEPVVVFRPTALHTFRALQCPASPLGPESSPPGATHYVAIAGLGLDSPDLPKGHPRIGIFGYDRQTRIEDIKDGAANTMMLAETATANGPWIAGGTATLRGLDPAQSPYVGRNRQFGGYHRDGAMVLFADGSVRLIKESISNRVFQAYSTMAGSEQVIRPAADLEVLPPPAAFADR
jgi:prepilin-type processing-associated H-X9-DG protein